MLSNVSLGSLRFRDTAEIHAISSAYFSHDKNTICLEKVQLVERGRINCRILAVIYIPSCIHKYKSKFKGRKYERAP